MWEPLLAYLPLPKPGPKERIKGEAWLTSYEGNREMGQEYGNQVAQAGAWDRLRVPTWRAGGGLVSERTDP